MFALARDFMARQHNFDALPVHILRDFFVNEVLELFRQLGHKLRAGCYTVTIKGFLLGHLQTGLERLLFGNLCIQSSSESSCSLLIHFGPWRHSIYRHEEELLWLDLPKEVFN